MDDLKAYLSFFGVIALVVVLSANISSILPIMDDDEYFVDEYGNIHGNGCPYMSVPWFTRKSSKYDILIKNDEKICGECLLLEEDKLMWLHNLNLDAERLRLERAGAPDEYIENKLMLYKKELAIEE